MRNMKLLLTALVLFLALSLSAQSVAGKWKFELPSDQGTMVIAADIKADGTYTLDFGNDGSVEVNGKYAQEGDKMTISDSGGDCSGKGVYTVAVTDSSLTMTRVSDECPNRGGPSGVMTATRI